MFQGDVHGLALAWCQFAGNVHDQSTVVKALIVEDLKNISDKLGVVYSHFADSASTQSSYMHVIQRWPVTGCLQVQ